MPIEEDSVTKRRLAQSEEIDRMTRQAIQAFHDQNERQRLTLGPAHERMLEYFWNSKRKQERAALPISVAHFFESSDSPDNQHMLIESSTNLVISELVAKGYLVRTKRQPDQYNFMVRDEDMLTLTSQGLKYLWRRHPPVLLWWTKLLDATPSSVSLLITIIGLVASVVGIIDFLRK
jgi:hypothetical protein